MENGLSHNTIFTIHQDQLGFMWFGTKDGLNRYDGHQFKIFKNIPGDPSSLKNNHILSLFEGKDNNLWVGTNDGVSIYYPGLEQFKNFEAVDQNGDKVWGQILKIKEDQHGQIWIASSSAGLYKYHIEKETLTRYYHDPNNSKTLGSGSVSSLTIDKDGNIWVGILGGGVEKYLPNNDSFLNYPNATLTLKKDLILDLYDHGEDLLIGTKNNGVKIFNKNDGSIQNLLNKDAEGNPLFVRNIIQTDLEEIYIGTELGVFIYDFKTKNFNHLTQNPNDPYSLSDNATYSIYKDNEGGIWIGTYFGGLNYLSSTSANFEKYYPIINKDSPKGKRVREIVEDQYGIIWVGTEDAGLSKFDPKTQKFKNYLPEKGKNSLSYHNVHGLMIDGRNLWISSHSQGLRVDILNLSDNSFKKLDQSALQNPLFDTDIFSIFKDSKGNKWFGTISGVYRMASGENEMKFFKDLSISFYYDIIEDHAGNIWFATINNGLFRLSPIDGKIDHFLPDTISGDGLPGISIISLFEDSNQRIWVGTEGYGLGLFDPKKNQWSVFKQSDGLPSNTIYKILEDDAEYLWISTGNGLVRFNPNNKSIERYSKSDGLLSDQFNYKSGLKASDGTLYFGTLNGFVSFNPTTLTKQPNSPKLILTGIKLFNEELFVGSGDGILKSSITSTKSIYLSHDQSSLSFSFAALSYSSPESWKYLYKLEGLEKDWNVLEKNNDVSYLNIPPGTYKFVVKTITDNGEINQEEASLNIKITPPFYFSKIAYTLYSLISASILFGSILLYRKRIQKRHQKNIESLESQKEKEIFNAKIEFFTNITHEIRTPLTLIKGPLEVMLKKENFQEQETKENLKIMEKNADRLIHLSNQLLDFRKAEKQSFRLNFVKIDISRLLQDIQYRFKPLAEKDQIFFKLTGVENSFFADVDQEELIKIISNLVTNAFKYATHQVIIDLIIESGEYFLIVVSNDGPLINKAYRDKIFEPFYQIDPEETQKPRQGTGLGLPLARSLAEMHKGFLYYEDKHLVGLNSFILKLPVRQSHTFFIDENQANLDDNKIDSEAIERIKITTDVRQTILIVEDNKELQSFIESNLKYDYHMLKASHGLDAIALLEHHQVDLIISDIMMPMMDGIELCQHIKSNLIYSHIPLILLTAKNSIQSKIEGLEVGADVYIEKPFSLEYLVLQVKNLLKYRDQVRDSFANSPGVLSVSIAHTKADEVFLEEVNRLISNHISNEQFGVNELAEILNMSQSSLLRKIKGISKLTPNEYIRLVRLKKSAELLSTGKYSVAEVCDLVGFNSPSYFSKCFQKQFGELPKDYQKSERS
ncbi:two-component regulator propeller domain-containing protein [Belliella pelovolcani]|nr:two-component regulator propeller domain-containing protein [Belliella pelovolcani]